MPADVAARAEAVPSEGWRPAGAVLVLHTRVEEVRATVVSDTATVLHHHVEPVGTGATRGDAPAPATGPVGDAVDDPVGDAVDGGAVAAAVLRAARAAVSAVGGVRAIALASAPGIVVAWDGEEGAPVAAVAGRHGPAALGAWLDELDPERRRGLLLGPLDTWVVWTLTEGARHVTDATSAAATGLLVTDGSGWDPAALGTARLHTWALPQLAVAAGPLAEAIPLAGCPPILANCSEDVAAVLGAGRGDPTTTVVLRRDHEGSSVVARWLGPLAGHAAADATPTTSVPVVARSSRWYVQQRRVDHDDPADELAGAAAAVPAGRTVVVNAADTADTANGSAAGDVPTDASAGQPGAVEVVARADAVCRGAVALVGVALGRWSDPAGGPLAPTVSASVTASPS